MNRIIGSFFCLLVTLVTLAQDNYERFTRDLPFSMQPVAAPVFPETKVVLTEFGAVGDGQQLCTEAFAHAIDALVAKGGGHLVVPQGIWLTGPIVLQSNIDLHLEAGAVIMFAADEDLYPLVETSFEGVETRRCQSPLSARNAENIAVTGLGVIDGNGQYWRPLHRRKLTDSQWKKMTQRTGGVMMRDDYWVPSESYAKGENGADMNVPKVRSEAEWNGLKRFLRPVMVSLVECRKVLLQGVVFQNSPAWNLHPLMCEDMIIDRVLVMNPSYSQNGDALDLESCRRVLIVDSRFNAGDDGICLKSGKNEDGRRRGRPCEQVVVDGCTVFSGHGGFVVGSEMSGGVRNIMVRNCQFLGTQVGLRFKSTRGRGGVVENIFIDGVSMTDIETYALTFNMYYRGKSVAEVLAEGSEEEDVQPAPVDETTPVFRNIDIRNVCCNNALLAMEFNGLPEMPIDNIRLKNIKIVAEHDAVFKYCKNIVRENVTIQIEKAKD